MDGIILQENQKVSAEEESHGNIESGFDQSEIYQVNNMSLEDTKEKLEWRKRAFKHELKNTYGIEN